MITDLNKLFLENEGECPVHFTIFDPLDGVEVRMPSKTIKIGVSNEIFKKLQDFKLEFEIK